VKRVSVTLGDDLETALEGYVSTREAQPTITAVIQAALRQFLIHKGCFDAARNQPRRRPRAPKRERPSKEIAVHGP
jgi:hypothetical protein